MKPNGKGIQHFKNGVKSYAGEFKSGTYHGYGVKISEKDIPVYEGEWNMGIPNGKGSSFDENGKMN